MSPLVPALVLAGGLYALVELYYRLEHKPRLRDSYEQAWRELGMTSQLPDESWFHTLVQIRGLQDTRQRGLVYDWQVGDWYDPADFTWDPPDVRRWPESE